MLSLLNMVISFFPVSTVLDTVFCRFLGCLNLVPWSVGRAIHHPLGSRRSIFPALIPSMLSAALSIDAFYRCFPSELSIDAFHRSFLFELLPGLGCQTDF